MELDSKLSDSMACYNNDVRIIIIVKIVTIFNSCMIHYYQSTRKSLVVM
jgi:hypothetical protein